MRSSPPAWGCSEEPVRHGSRWIVLPTSVGVFRWAPTRCTTPGSPPHQRGGVPPSDYNPHAFQGSSPPAWGCSVEGRRAGFDDAVLPTSVGVFRAAGRPPRRTRRPPHQRGGVPRGSRGTGYPAQSSPPAWGCSVGLIHDRRRSLVLPTSVGVFRSSPMYRTVGSCPPHQRGGVPHAPSRTASRWPSSPPAWGCSVVRLRRRAGHVVLPTSVGVFRQLARAPSPARCPPHQRGGVPPVAMARRGTVASSPPAWGCSDGIDSHVFEITVLPTSVGVFRCRAIILPVAVGPPHQRGGVPKIDRSAIPLPGSSPPAWGCSVHADQQEERHQVLPTSVGVFRSPWPVLRY